MDATQFVRKAPVILGRCRLSALLAALVIAVMPAASRASITYVTPSGSESKDGPVDATATFTLSSGHVLITLTSLLENPTADGQLISAILFNVSGASGTGALASTNSGNISTIDISDGTYSAGVSDPLTRWEASHTGTAVTLTTLSGGKPNRLIIGPDSLGNFNPALGGLYDQANASIDQHNPVVLGTATFDIAIAGVTSDSVLSDVVFQFGTDANESKNKIPGRLPGVPEPSSIVMVSMALGAAGVLARRRRRAA
jgi:hypothetical protein